MLLRVLCVCVVVFAGGSKLYAVYEFVHVSLKSLCVQHVYILTVLILIYYSSPEYHKES